jgi:hypothetical protein
MSRAIADGVPSCPCPCRPNGASCREELRGIERTWGLCALCHIDQHWQPGDDEAAFDWPQIFADAEVFALGSAGSTAGDTPETGPSTRAEG